MRVKCKCVICSCSSEKTTKHKYILFLMSNPFVLDTYPVSLSACLLIGTTLNSLSGIKIKPSKEWQSNPTFIYISTPHLQKHCSPLYSTSYVRAAWLCWDKLCFTEYVRICIFFYGFPHFIYKQSTSLWFIHRKVHLWSSPKSFLIDHINDRN